MSALSLLPSFHVVVTSRRVGTLWEGTDRRDEREREKIKGQREKETEEQEERE